MEFKEIYPKFIMGFPIKRKDWGGYWKFNVRLNMPVIYLKTGGVLPFEEVSDWDSTIGNMMEDDWEIATEENTTIKVVD